MTEVVKSYIYELQEVVELLIKKENLHEGIWGLSVEFRLGAASTGPSENELYPTGVCAVAKLGLQRVNAENNMSLDATKVNPA